MVRRSRSARRAVIAAIGSLMFAASAAGGAAATTTPDDTAGGTAPAGMSSEEWDAIVTAANEEGKVTLYTAQAFDQGNNLKAAFEAEYPDITVDVVRDISSNLIPKIEAERADRQRHRRRLRLRRHRMVADRSRRGAHHPDGRAELRRSRVRPRRAGP